MPQVLEAREGYELWRPNREKPEAKTTKAIVAFVLLISAALLVLITIGGWDRLQSSTVAFMTIGWALLYVLFAFLVMRWNRGVLPVTAALAVIMIIFAAVAAGGWFARDKPGLESPMLPEDLLGLLTLIVIPVQLLLLIVAMVGFNQQWSVEEERPIGGAPPPGGDPYGAPRDTAATGETVTGARSEQPTEPIPPTAQGGAPAAPLIDDEDGDDWNRSPNPAV
jgi:hypothetical protein